MKLVRHACLLLATLLALAAAPALAVFDPVGEDIDIFLANPSFTAERPNVLLFLDNSANWSASAGSSTKFDVEKTALTTVVSGLTSSMNLGLMFFPQQGDSGDGGYVRYAIRQMVDTNKSALVNLISNLGRTSDNASSGVSTSLAMAEVFKYFGGLTAGPGGQAAVKRDCPGNTSNSYAASLGSHAFSGCSSTTYISPILNGCQKNFVIVISNGTTSSTNLNKDAEAALTTAMGGAPSQITVSPANDDWTDEWAKFMASADCNATFSGTQTVTTYVVEVDPGASTTAQTWTAMLKSAAFQGKGRYISVSVNAGADALITAMREIFQEVQAVNSVFASTTLPVSVNVRGTNLNQVYIGVFRPDANKLPRWFGNLKLYNLKVANNELFLADATGAQATNDQKGFISQSARSFWTTASTFWNFRAGTYADTDVGQASDSPDGDLVEKGGAAQQLRIAYASDHSSRKMYTCTGACPCAGNSCTTPVALSDSPFNAANTNITALALGTMSTVPVISLSSVGNMVTGTTAAAHGFNNGDTVVIAGASPALYNGSYTITTAGPTSTAFTYTVSSSPSGNTATVAANGHGLVSGDLIDVTGSSQAGYNVTGAAITRVDANSFTYTLGAAVATASSGHSVSARKLVTSISGIGTAATVSLPGHGLSGSVTISGATPAEFNVTKTISVVDADTFTYTLNSSLTGSSANARGTTSAAHGFVVGDTITINCATPLAYNTTTAISAATSTTFTFALPSAQSSDASVTTAPTGCTGATAIKATKSGASSVNVTAISTTDPSTVTITSAGHPFSTGDSVTIAGVTPALFNGTYTVTSFTTNTFTYTKAIEATASTTTSPATGTSISATVGSQTLSIASNMTHGSGGNVTTVTVNTGSTSPPSGFVVGATVVIANAAQSAYNGTFKIKSVTTNGSNRGFTYVTGLLSEVPAPTLSSATASGSITRNLTALQRTFVGTGTVYAGKPMTVTSITSQNNATGTITAANTTSGDATGRANLINWVRSQDNKDNENAPTNTSFTDVRASAHGDVLHSRPAIVNYNRGGAGGSNTGDDDVFAYYGGNDGILHAVQGGFASNGGQEIWSFVAPEFFGKLKRLRDNTLLIGQSSGTSAPRDYFFDGPIGVYTLDVNNDGKILASAGDKVYLFIGMRRGGRYLYALDVSDPNAPKFMWKRGCPNLYNADGSANNTGCDAGYEELGMTWSEPKVAFLRAYANPVLIFGAGYDPAVEDVQPCLATDIAASGVTWASGGTVTFNSAGGCSHTGTTPKTTSRVMGRGIFIVDATNGTLLKHIRPTGMDYAIPADIVVLNRDRDTTRTLPGRENIQPLLSGFADRIYAVDTGGNVWRVDVDSATTGSWVTTKIASLAGGSLGEKRKFIFAPDIVFGQDSSPYDAVLVGSGDREHPFDATVTNRFYMLKDRNTGINVTSHTTIIDTTFSSTVTNGLFDATNNCLQDRDVCPDGSSNLAAAQAAIVSAPGWKLTLGTGEKNVGTATTLAGTVFFNTNQPSGSAGGGSCGSNLGIARQYQVGYADATATQNLNSVDGLQTADRSTIVEGGGFLPSPVPLIVEIDGQKYQAVISGVQVQTPPGLQLESRVRSYWYRKIE